ncbi:MAG: histidine kinase [Flavobacteriaceae bacterium]|nr:histidine kinase [Flavobacteriaceae bacterium]
MRKVKSSFGKALLTTIILTIVMGALILYKEKEAYHILIAIFAMFFATSFISFAFFDEKDKITKNILRISVPSFFATYLIVFLYLIFAHGEHIPFFNIGSLFNGISQAVLSLFLIAIQVIQTKSSDTKIYKNVRFSYFELALIPFLVSLFWCILMIIFTYELIENFSQIFYTIERFYKLFPVGFFTAFLSIHFFNYIYSTFSKSKRSIIFVLMYLFLTLIVSFVTLIFSNFEMFKDNPIALILGTDMIFGFVYYLTVLISTHLYFVYLLNKQEKTTLKRKTLQSQLNYQQLKNQLSPHFLFNNINVLTSLIEENPQKAIIFSEKLSNIYRYFLEQEKEDVVQLSEEISFAKDYLHLLKSRFEKGLSFSIDLSESSLQKFVTSTSLQQILENSIKHNEVSEEKELNITIRSDEEYVTISNNKNPKLYSEKSLQKGIENIRKRYTYFTDKEVIITQDEQMFSIQLPLLTV